MKKSDKIIFGLIMGFVFPVLFALVAFIVGFNFFREESLPYFFAAGLLSGVIADILFLKRLIPILFDLPVWLCVGFYITGNIIIYGMFMGFPVFNLLPGTAAGYYTGRRILINNNSSHQREAIVKNVPLFTALIMFLICISSAYLALNEKTIGEELQGMLGLSFVPSLNLIITGIIAGGIALILLQYFITRIVLIITLKSKSA
jgi:hypothetical protein